MGPRTKKAVAREYRVAFAPQEGISTQLRPWPSSLVPLMRKRADEDLFFFCRDVLGMTLLEEETHGRLCRPPQRRHQGGFAR